MPKLPITINLRFMLSPLQMLKRKRSHDAEGSILGARRQRRLFRADKHHEHSRQPETKRDMTELLEYILKHEEAFQKYVPPV